MLIDFAHELSGALAPDSQVAGRVVWLDGYDLRIRDTAPVPKVGIMGGRVRNSKDIRSLLIRLGPSPGSSPSHSTKVLSFFQ